MGEIAEMMLEGSMCQGCGEYLGDGDGFPVFCAACERRNRSRDVSETAKPAKPIVPCPTCGKEFRSESSMVQHSRDAHDLTFTTVFMRHAGFEHVIEQISDLIDETCEINLGNYTEDQVAEVNNALIQIQQMIAEAREQAK